MLFSGAADEFTVSTDAYSILIHPFVVLLFLHQQLYPYPPDPQIYEGEYTLPNAGGNVTVYSHNNQMLISGEGQQYYLAYYKPYNFQVGCMRYTCSIVLDYAIVCFVYLYAFVEACVAKTAQTCRSICMQYNIICL